MTDVKLKHHFKFKKETSIVSNIRAPVFTLAAATRLINLLHVIFDHSCKILYFHSYLV